MGTLNHWEEWMGDKLEGENGDRMKERGRELEKGGDLWMECNMKFKM